MATRGRQGISSCGGGCAPKHCRCCLDVPDYQVSYERLQQQLNKLQRQNRLARNTANPREPEFGRRGTHFAQLHERQKQKIEQARRENSVMHGSRSGTTTPNAPGRLRSAQSSQSRPRPRSAGSQRERPPGPRSARSQRDRSTTSLHNSSTSSPYASVWRPQLRTSRPTSVNSVRSRPQSASSVRARPQSASPARFDTSNMTRILNSENILKIVLAKRWSVHHARWAKMKYQTLDLCSLANSFSQLKRIPTSGSSYAKIQRIRRELGNSSLAECIRECIGGHLPDGKHMGRLVEFLIDDDLNDIRNLTEERFTKFTWHLKNFQSDLNFEETAVFAMFEPKRCTDEAFNLIQVFFRKTFTHGRISREGGCTLNDFIRLSGSNCEGTIVEPDFDRLEEVLQRLRLRRRKDHAAWTTKAFNKLDLDGSGDLTRTELGSNTCAVLLKQSLNEFSSTRSELDGKSLKLLVDLMFARADADGHSRISREEFDDFTWLIRAAQASDASTLSQIEVDVGFETRLLFSLFTPVKSPIVDEVGLHKVLHRHGAVRLRRQQRTLLPSFVYTNEYQEEEYHAVSAEMEIRPDVADRDTSRHSTNIDQDAPDQAVMRKKLRERRRRQHSRWVSDVFGRLDLDRSGKLTRMELDSPVFVRAVQECMGNDKGFAGKESGEMRRLVNFSIGKADVDGDNNISRQEFEHFTWQLRNLQSDVDMETDFIFAMFDIDKNNKIDLKEYERLFNFQSGGGGSISSKEYIKRIMQELDQDNDGNISRDEFRAWAATEATTRDLDDCLEDSQDFMHASTDQGGHKTWAAKAYGTLDTNGSGTITRSQLSTDMFLTMVQEFHQGQNLRIDDIMCMVDLALKRSSFDGDYEIKRSEFDLMMWKLRMMSTQKQRGRRIESSVPTQQRLAIERRNSYKIPRKLNLQGLDQKPLAVAWSSTEKARIYEKLRTRRRRDHYNWAKRKFNELDLDGNGGLSRLELGTPFFATCIRDCLGESQHLPGLSYMKTFVNFVLGRADADGDHHLSLEEFENFTWQVKNMQSDHDFETEFLFAMFDPDRNHKLDLQEFEKLFNFHSKGGGTVSSHQYIKDIMAELDEDGDGSISFAEYRSWQRGQSGLLSESGGESLMDAELLDPDVRRRNHQDSAYHKFACLVDERANRNQQGREDSTARGYVTRNDLCSPKFLEMLQGTLPKRALEINIIMPLVDFLLGKQEGTDYHVSNEEFETLLWKIQKLDMKAWGCRSDDNIDGEDSLCRSGDNIDGENSASYSKDVSYTGTYSSRSRSPSSSSSHVARRS